MTEINKQAKRNEKMTKYRQLAFQLRQRRPGYDISIVPIVIDSLGEGIKEVLRGVGKSI